MRLPKQLDGKLFVLKTIDRKTSQITNRNWMVTTKILDAIIGAKALEANVGDFAIPVLEIWTDGAPCPDGIMQIAEGGEKCEGCKHKGGGECIGDDELLICAMKSVTPEEFLKGDLDKHKPIPEAPKEKAEKPSGLRHDTDIADLLLEAFKAMEERNGKQ